MKGSAEERFTRIYSWKKKCLNIFMYLRVMLLFLALQSRYRCDKQYLEFLVLNKYLLVELLPSMCIIGTRHQLEGTRPVFGKPVASNNQSNDSIQETFEKDCQCTWKLLKLAEQVNTRFIGSS